MKKEEKKLDVVFIIDKSGSMHNSEESTITSFNEYLEKEKKNSFKTLITTVLFSDTHSTLYHRKNIKDVNPMTLDDYKVSGCTALLDTIGDAIHQFDREDTDKVLFIIITDGYENASKEYNNSNIRNLIKKHSEWEFLYIGADIDSYEAGGNIGIKRDNIVNFKKDRTGTKHLFDAVKSFESAMMSDRSSSNWKDELEQYLEQNKN